MPNNNDSGEKSADRCDVTEHFMLIPGQSYRGRLPQLCEAEHVVSQRLQHDVAYLSEIIGERNTCCADALIKTEKYISKQLTELGYDIRLETYQADGIAVSNIEATLAGQGKPGEIIIVGAHYDSAPGTPGADDNASAIAVLLELARQLKNSKPKYTIRFVAFVNEEPPFYKTELMGSYVYALGCKQRTEKINAMLCLESMGFFSNVPGSQIYPSPLGALYPDTADFIAFCGNIASSSLLYRCIKHFRSTTQFPSEGIVASEKFIPLIECSDHWAFWQMGYSAIMVTDTAFLRNPHYHLPSDTQEHLDYARMARVSEGIKRVIEKLALIENGRSIHREGVATGSE